MVLIALLAVPSMVFAANKLAIGEAAVAAETVTIPLEITNQDGLMAMDIPLKFSEGVTLKEVTFNDTRVSYFDLKVADIDNENRTVAIGLITQITAERRPDLAEGTGTVANLVFEVTDPEVAQVSLEAVTMSKPDHELMFIYHEYADGKVVNQRVEDGKFEPFSLALSGTGGDNLPDHFALMQNYPNPFNPTTIIAFDLPVASEYKLTIYNILGQVVNDISGTSDAGRVEVEWDATAFASGVYFYKINAGDFTDTKKMLLVK
jgi:hypothetical protein